MAQKTSIRQELVDELLKDYRSPSDLMGPDGILTGLFGRLIEAITEGELTAHLGYERGDPAGRGSGNSRNGTTPKTLLTDQGPVRVELARDRNGTFEPQAVPKGETHWSGFDDKIISLYAGGMSYEDIAGHLRDLYGVEVSKEFISRVTDSVLDDVRAWQSRPLDACYPVIWIDALVAKIKVDRTVRNVPVYLVLGLNLDGKKEALALVVGTEAESSKFWLSVLNGLAARGLKRACVVCCDGLTALEDSITSVWQDSYVQTCTVHLIRNSLKLVSYKDYRAVVADLRPIYQAATAADAEAALDAFDKKWGRRYPGIGELWRRQWHKFTPFFEFSAEIRRIIYTTNSIEAVNRQLRKIIKTKGHFPSEDAALKLLWLALIRAEKKWTYPIRDWKQALQQFAIHFPHHFTLN